MLVNSGWIGLWRNGLIQNQAFKLGALDPTESLSLPKEALNQLTSMGLNQIADVVESYDDDRIRLTSISVGEKKISLQSLLLTAFTSISNPVLNCKDSDEKFRSSFRVGFVPTVKTPRLNGAKQDLPPPDEFVDPELYAVNSYQSRQKFYKLARVLSNPDDFHKQTLKNITPYLQDCGLRLGTPYWEQVINDLAKSEYKKFLSPTIPTEIKPVSMPRAKPNYAKAAVNNRSELSQEVPAVVIHDTAQWIGDTLFPPGHFICFGSEHMARRFTELALGEFRKNRGPGDWASSERGVQVGGEWNGSFQTYVSDQVWDKLGGPRLKELVLQAKAEGVNPEYQKNSAVWER